METFSPQLTMFQLQLQLQILNKCCSSSRLTVSQDTDSSHGNKATSRARLDTEVVTV